MKNKRKYLKKEPGITLIALVITRDRARNVRRRSKIKSK